ncbi:type IV pilin protein [Tepidimonas sp.]|uniref:type IV pilin protein n=2 Tax=Tepidimonas sp. TaxID=2002775 RepID=UPI002FDF0E3E
MEPTLSPHTPSRAERPTRARGFTLIEVMIVVAIIGILAAIAYPSYTRYVREARRADAVAAITRVQLAQERYRANNPAYAGDLATLGITSNTSPDGYYTVAISGQSATGYTVTATAVSGGPQANDTGCTTIAMVVSGGSATPSPGSAACWKK